MGPAYTECSHPESLVCTGFTFPYADHYMFDGLSLQQAVSLADCYRIRYEDLIANCGSLLLAVQSSIAEQLLLHYYADTYLQFLPHIAFFKTANYAGIHGTQPSQDRCVCVCV